MNSGCRTRCRIPFAVTQSVIVTPYCCDSFWLTWSLAVDAAVSTASARLGPAASNRPLDAAPALGFSGAAAIDDAGQFAGMVVLKPMMVAGPAPAPQAAVVPREKVMSFLDANYVAPASGQPGVEQAKAAVVRVICVRK